MNVTLTVVLFTLLVNTPTIRPLMSMLGLDRLTKEERLELRHALLGAREEAEHLLMRCRTPEITSKEAYEEVKKRTGDTFKPPKSEVDEPGYVQDRYVAELLATRWKMDELKSLYKQGVMPQYIHLGICNELQNERYLDEQIFRKERRSIVFRLGQQFLPAHFFRKN